MSREIKFRAWDGEKIITGDALYWNGISFVSGVWNFEEDCIPSENQVAAELMQYTGLKDKNGIEIYEGDIVERDKNCMFNEGRQSSSVFFEEGLFRIGSVPLHIVVDSFNAGVIGNIYQNPELLDGE